MQGGAKWASSRGTEGNDEASLGTELQSIGIIQKPEQNTASSIIFCTANAGTTAGPLSTTATASSSTSTFIFVQERQDY